jgi:ribose 5-phosphate isomerase A
MTSVPSVNGTNLDAEKKLAAEAAAELVSDGMRVGLGTGSTVAHLLPALAARDLKDLRCVATSVATEDHARELGIAVEDFDKLDRLDIAIDGADQIAPDRWLVKGGGGAHTREKIVAATAEEFVVIADSSKMVERITAPIPVELSAFGLASTLARIKSELGELELRPDTPRSPDNGVIADFSGKVHEPGELAARLSLMPGVVDHGLFPAGMVGPVLIGRGDSVERI